MLTEKQLAKNRLLGRAEAVRQFMRDAVMVSGGISRIMGGRLFDQATMFTLRGVDTFKHTATRALTLTLRGIEISTAKTKEALGATYVAANAAAEDTRVFVQKMAYRGVDAGFNVSVRAGYKVLDIAYDDIPPRLAAVRDSVAAGKSFIASLDGKKAAVAAFSIAAVAAAPILGPVKPVKAPLLHTSTHTAKGMADVPLGRFSDALRGEKLKIFAAPQDDMPHIDRTDRRHWWSMGLTGSGLKLSLCLPDTMENLPPRGQRVRTMACVTNSRAIIATQQVLVSRGKDGNPVLRYATTGDTLNYLKFSSDDWENGIEQAIAARFNEPPAKDTVIAAAPAMTPPVEKRISQPSVSIGSVKRETVPIIKKPGKAHIDSLKRVLAEAMAADSMAAAQGTTGQKSVYSTSAANADDTATTPQAVMH